MTGPDFEQEALEQLREERRLKRLEEKKRRQFQQRTVLAVLALILVLAIVLIVRGCQAGQKPSQPELPAQTPGNEAVDPNQPQDVPVDEDADTVVTISAVGDIMLYEDQLELALQENGTYDFSDTFTAVSSLTMEPDLMIGNLELNFCGEPYTGKPSFRAPEAFAEALRDAGFDMLQTANTASITNGISGLTSTIARLDTVGIDHVGTYATAEAKAENEGVLLKNINGIRIAFIAYTKGVNNLSLPEGSEYAVDLLYEDYHTEYTTVDTKAIDKSLKAAQAMRPDLTVALLHWGTEWDATPGETQEQILEQLLEGGVDVILGSHPHVIGEIEMRTIPDGEGGEKSVLIAYSLGNFLASPAAQTRSRTMESLMLHLELTKNGKTGATSITGVSYTPLYIARTLTEMGEAIQVLPVRQAIKSGLFPDIQQDLTDTIAHLRADTASDYDSGR